MSHKITVITADGSEWELTNEYVAELQRDYETDENKRPGVTFEEWMEDVVYDWNNSFDDFLFPNARLKVASPRLSYLLDGVNSEDDDPYENGFERPDVRIE